MKISQPKDHTYEDVSSVMMHTQEDVDPKDDHSHSRDYH